MNILVLQHLDVEHPGIFRKFMKDDGFSWDTIQLDQGEEIPPLERYDFMLVMGGPQDVWEIHKYPWLATEKAAIRRFVTELERPYLGICLGHQLLAEAIGGTVGPSSAPEVGVMTVEKGQSAGDGAILSGLDEEFYVLQWHGAEVKSLPEDTSILAHSPRCAVQAFSYKSHAFGLQFHLEVTNETVAEWGGVPAYAASLEAAMGLNAIARLKEDLAGALPTMNGGARAIYQNVRRVLKDVRSKERTA